MATKKKAATKKSTKQTFVALVLDESASMGSMQEAARELFNAQAAEIRKNAKKGGATKVSLFKFGQHAPPHVCEVFHARPATDVPTLEAKDYRPQNGTPMRDGIGLAITRLETEDDGGKDTAFLVVVVTDGQENQSREWSAERLRKKVSELQATGRWTFAVYGANISLADLHEVVGFDLASLPATNFGTYRPDSAGVAVASASLSRANARYMSARAAGATISKSFVGEDEN